MEALRKDLARGAGMKVSAAVRQMRPQVKLVRNWRTKRELERQFQSGGVRQLGAAARKVSPALGRIRPTALDEVKNAYSVELPSVVTRRSEQQA